MQRDSIANTFIVAIGVCLVCSLLVSGAAVGLRSMQQKNIELDMKKNILQAAGFPKDEINSAQKVEDLFANRVDPIIIDLKTGQPAAQQLVDTDEELGSVQEALTDYDQISTAKDAKSLDSGLATKVPDDKNIAGVSKIETYSHVYLVKDESGKVVKYVFPVRGKGLWSILKGFIAVKNDLNTIAGLTYYEHLETPGLGGEVDAPWWKQLWRDPDNPKKIFDSDGNVEIHLVKGAAEPNDEYAVDGLSGATITSRGVTNMLKFWMGPDGFGPFIKRLDKQEELAVSQPTPSKKEVD
ncbi:MAG: Na(+)-translocating NADH-quinone reductase subunit C [Mariniblastus sp.]|nr:Na(+)-translocating NADH-quinone reductase subunit C [Mariniblastus sp.]